MSFSIQDISYQFQNKSEPILKNISFSIEEGEITAIVGKSGCGKTTLADILSGVIPKMLSTGNLTGSCDLYQTHKIAVVSQSPENQLFGYSVEDAIVFGVENMGLDHMVIGERLEYVLDLLNIQHLRKRSVATLSGGQRQAVCIASTLAMEPEILIMDEPVSSLDPKGKAMVQQIIHQLKQTGQTTVIIDNNLDWCSDIVEHIIGLENGSIAFDGTREEFFSDFDIQKRLGVYIPQEVEIYRALKEKFPQVSMFYTLDGAKEEIAKLIPLHERPEKEIVDPAYEYAVEVKNLNKTFPDGFHALMDINTAFPKGKVSAILGQNGSGKTTLVRHLNGLIKATSGQIFYMGTEVKDKSVAEISRDIILVFQHPEHMLFEETVYKELTFCAKAQGLNFTEEEIEKVLNDYDFQDVREEFPVNLAMGKKHILTILSVLFSSAEVIILDEPTLGLDNALKLKLKEIIRNLIERGKTVIMISHEIPLVFEVSDYIYLLNNGKSMFSGSIQNMVEHIDLLESASIAAPPVVKLARMFGLDGSVVTAQAFADAVQDRVKEGGAH